MNVYCQICTKEMEVIEDFGTVVKVHPCGCANDNAALRAELTQVRGERDAAQEKVKSVTALVNEWRYIANERPMPTDRAIGLESCADELAAALRGQA